MLGKQGKIKDITGQQFGRLSVVMWSHIGSSRLAYWLCECDCGELVLTTGHTLRRKQRQSCGCLLKKDITDRQITARSVFSEYKTSAKSRKRDFSLSLEDVTNLIFKPCNYCGHSGENIHHSEYYSKRRKPTNWNGIDRVDNALGYTPDNVVPCCRTCNLAKRGLSVAEFLDWVNRMYHFNVGRE